MRINHNIQALNAYRNLAANQLNTSKNLERLSSGLRINRAADDAAGLAISEKMRSQIRGLGMAERNALDAVSLIQTAEGALQETQSILQRMRELSVQAANSTYTDEDRNHIQSEIDQLKEEIDRISSAAEFNNIDLLDGSISEQFKATQLDPNTPVQYDNTGLNNLKIDETSPLVTSTDYQVKIVDKGSKAYQALDLSQTIVSTGVQSVLGAEEDLDLIQGSYKVAITEESVTSVIGAPVTNNTGISKIDVLGNSSLNGSYDINITRNVSDNFIDGNGFSNFATGSVLNPQGLDGVYTMSTQQVMGQKTETPGKLENLSANVGSLDLDRGEYRMQLSWNSDHYEAKIEKYDSGTSTWGAAAAPYDTAKVVGSNSTVAWGELSFDVGNLAVSGDSASVTFDIDSKVTLKNNDTNQSVEHTIKPADTNPVTITLDNNQYKFDVAAKPSSTTFTISSTYDVELLQGGVQKAITTVGTNASTANVGDVSLSFGDISVNSPASSSTASFNIGILPAKFAQLQDAAGNPVDGQKLKVNTLADELDLGYGLKLKYDPSTIVAGTTTFVVEDKQTPKDFRAILIEGGLETSVEVAISESGQFVLGEGITFSTGTSLQEGTVDFDIISTEKDASLIFQIGANEGQTLKLGINGMSTEDLNVEAVSVQTADAAGLAIAALDEAINKVSGERAKLGAIQNRLEHTMNNLQVTNENMVASESRIRDLDMAAEMTEFTKNNILNQAAQAMLAQSNQLPQGILQLLK